MSDIVLIHGMGRTPLSMLVLRQRLSKAGHRVWLLGYAQAFESLERVCRRLQTLIRRRVGRRPYALVGHSLGTVIIRASLAGLQDCPPSACYFLAPPMQACRLARRLSGRWLYRGLTGEMGQLLANEQFMASLPMPTQPTRIYAGVAGPRGRVTPFGEEANDGILALSEASHPHVPVLQIASLHTFIMNSRAVSHDLLASLEALGLGAASGSYR